MENTDPYLERRKKWVEALRSGEYIQTSGVLSRRWEVPTYDPDTRILSGMEKRTSHCCLGVACDLAVKEGFEIEVRPENQHNALEPSEEYIFYGREEYYLPLSVQEWYGIPTQDGKFMMEYGSSTLAQMNDNGATFDEIADKIEQIDRGVGYWIEDDE